MSIPLQLALAAWLATVSSAAPAGSAQDTAALEFHGFRAGARLDQIQTMVRRSVGGRLRCSRAKADPRVSECRGALSDSAIGAVELWVSAIDSVAGVITISAPVEAGRLQRWRHRIESRYGRVDPRVQGGQTMMQWVRRGRMLRLTWRTETKGKTASVSLVDGRVLDRWGRSRAAAPHR